MVQKSKLKRDQLGSTEQQAAQKWKPPPMVPHGRWKDPGGFDRPPAADPLAFTPKGTPGFEGTPWEKINAVRGGRIQGQPIEEKGKLQKFLSFFKEGFPGSPKAEGIEPSNLSEAPSLAGLGEDVLNALSAYPAFSAGGGLLKGAKGLLGKGAKAITPGQKIAQQRLNILLPELEIAAAKTATKQIAKKVSDKTIQKVAAQSGVSTEKVTKMVNAEKLRTKIKDIAGVEGSGFVKNLTPGKLAAKGWKFGKWAIGGALGADVIMTWYALDNVINGQVFFAKTLAEDVKWNNKDPQEALQLLNEAQDSRDIAITVVKISSAINPALWFFRNLMLSGIESHEEAIALHTLFIEEQAAIQREQGPQGILP